LFIKSGVSSLGDFSHHQHLIIIIIVVIIIITRL